MHPEIEMLQMHLGGNVVESTRLEECEVLPVLLEEIVASLPHLKEIGLHLQTETLPMHPRENVVESTRLEECGALPILLEEIVASLAHLKEVGLHLQTEVLSTLRDVGGGFSPPLEQGISAFTAFTLVARQYSAPFFPPTSSLHP